MLRVRKVWHTITFHRPPEYYLFATARNLVSEARHRRLREIPVDSCELLLPSDATAGEERAFLRADYFDVQSAVNRLRPRDRDLVWKRFWLDMSVADIAKAQGVTRSAVYSRLRRILRDLKTRLHGYRGVFVPALGVVAMLREFRRVLGTAAGTVTAGAIAVAIGIGPPSPPAEGSTAAPPPTSNTPSANGAAAPEHEDPSPVAPSRAPTTEPPTSVAGTSPRTTATTADPRQPTDDPHARLAPDPNGGEQGSYDVELRTPLGPAEVDGDVTGSGPAKAAPACAQEAVNCPEAALTTDGTR